MGTLKTVYYALIHSLIWHVDMAYIGGATSDKTLKKFKKATEAVRVIAIGYKWEKSAQNVFKEMKIFTVYNIAFRWNS